NHEGQREERDDRERHEKTLAPGPEDRGTAGRAGVSHPDPGKSARSSPFWAWRRFSAWSNTAELGESITSAATSSPRCAGRQWRKIASGSAISITRRVTR